MLTQACEMHVVLIPRLLKLDQIRNNEKNKEKEN
jgi:hypothetical protein